LNGRFVPINGWNGGLNGREIIYAKGCGNGDAPVLSKIILPAPLLALFLLIARPSGEPVRRSKRNHRINIRCWLTK
jgi:hypothetical protein